MYLSLLHRVNTSGLHYQVNKDPNVLPNHTLDFMIGETYGDESKSIAETVELLNNGVAAYIGPQETCTHEGKIAAAFNVPLISYVSRECVCLMEVVGGGNIWL